MHILLSIIFFNDTRWYYYTQTIELNGFTSGNSNNSAFIQFFKISNDQSKIIIIDYHLRFVD
jgi:hypothetical protein